MKAVILAGGKGTRLYQLTNNLLPKPLIALNDKPLIEYAIEQLIKNNVDEIFITVGHMHDVIENHFKNKHYKAKLNFIVEDSPLGSGGALYFLKDKIKGDFIVCNGDTLFDIDIDRMLNYHTSKNSIATLLVQANCHPFDSDLIITDENNRIIRIDSKNIERKFYYKNNVNAGFFIINEKAFYYFDKLKKVSMEGDFINALLHDGKKVFAYRSTEYVKDVGTPERYYNALKDLEVSLPAKRNLKNPQKAIFVDINSMLKFNKNVASLESLELINGIEKAVKLINNSEYLLVAVCNEAVSEIKEREELFNKMETLLGNNGAYIDERCSCTHNFYTNCQNVDVECNYKTLKNSFNLNFSESALICQSDKGKRGALSVLTEKGTHENKVFDSLYQAVECVLTGK